MGRGKNRANLAKHGVTFEEATEVFADPLSVTVPDPDHSKDEDRFVTLGATRNAVLVVVVHTDRDGRLRIISARKATPRERKNYESL